jgi:hypothetical protein
VQYQDRRCSCTGLVLIDVHGLFSDRLSPLFQHEPWVSHVVINSWGTLEEAGTLLSRWVWFFDEPVTPFKNDRRCRKRNKFAFSDKTKCGIKRS